MAKPRRTVPITERKYKSFIRGLRKLEIPERTLGAIRMDLTHAPLRVEHRLVTITLSVVQVQLSNVDAIRREGGTTRQLNAARATMETKVREAAQVLDDWQQLVANFGHSYTALQHTLSPLRNEFGA